MGGVVDFFVAIFILFMLLISFSALAYRGGYEDAMQQAFDRGFAVQCVGKSGYYWECE